MSQKQSKFITWKCSTCGYTYKVSQKENKGLIGMKCPRCRFRSEMQPNPQDTHENTSYKARNKRRRSYGQI